MPPPRFIFYVAWNMDSFAFVIFCSNSYENSKNRLTTSNCHFTNAHDPALSTSRPERLYENDDRREVSPQHADKIARILARLDQATRSQDLNLPGFRLHPLKGELAGHWSITVSANWRIIFRFEGQNATDVDLVDYH